MEGLKCILSIARRLSRRTYKRALNDAFESRMYSHLSFVVVFFGVASLTGPVHGSWNDDTLSAEDYYVNRLFLRRGNSDFTADQLDVQNQVLKSHNDYRAKHCAQALALDDKLSLSAQKYAESLARENKFDHSEGADYGENLFMKSSSKDIKNFNGEFLCCCFLVLLNRRVYWSCRESSDRWLVQRDQVLRFRESHILCRDRTFYPGDLERNDKDGRWLCERPQWCQAHVVCGGTIHTTGQC